MAKENEQDDVLEISDEDKSNESTDWKARALELEQKAIRQRESRKSLRDKYESEIASMKSQIEALSLTAKKEQPKSGDFGLLEKTFLRSAGYTAPEEVELFKKWYEETKKPLDELVDHPFIKTEIESMRTAKANQAATSNVRGEGGKSLDRDAPEYWIKRGELPEKTAANRKLRATIARNMIQETKSGKKFYNE